MRITLAVVLASTCGRFALCMQKDATFTRDSHEQTAIVDERETVVFQTKSLLPRASGPCPPQELSHWQGRGNTSLHVIDVWNQMRPAGVVYVAAGDYSCLVGPDASPLEPRPLKADDDVNETITEELWEQGVGRQRSPPGTSASAVQALTLVRSSTSPICTGNADAFQWVMPEVFTVTGPLLKYGGSRNNAVVWPRPGVCRPEAPCPMVIFLSGIGEHSEGFTPEQMLRSFESVHKFGFTRYVDRDPDCVDKLGAVLLFPELARDENWVRDGPSALKFFVLPLMEHVRQRAPALVDMDRVAVVGYSEGAFGALQAAVLYPDVFSFTVAAAASTREDWWYEVPVPVRSVRLAADEATHPWKLQMVLVALGEFDNTGDQAVNLRNVVHLMDESAVSRRAALQVRYYAGLYHKEVWERVFNQWATFHDIFWQGRYRSSRDGLEKAVHLQPNFKSVAEASAAAPQHPVARRDYVLEAKAAEAVRLEEQRRNDIEKLLRSGELDCDPDLPDCIPCSYECPPDAEPTCHICCRLECPEKDLPECRVCGADYADNVTDADVANHGYHPNGPALDSPAANAMLKREPNNVTANTTGGGRLS